MSSFDNFTFTTPSPGAPIHCFNQVDGSDIISYFRDNLEQVWNGYFEVRVSLASSIVLSFSILLIVRHMVTADRRSFDIKKFLRAKGSENDNSGSVVLQPLTTISYNMMMLCFRSVLYLMLLLPSVSAPSPYPRDFFAPLAAPRSAGQGAMTNGQFPVNCVFQPGWFGTSYVCLAFQCDPRSIADNVDQSYPNGSSPSSGNEPSNYREGRGPGCKACGLQFQLPDWYYDQTMGNNRWFVQNVSNCTNVTVPIKNSNHTSNETFLNCTNTTTRTLVNSSDVGALFYSTAHEDPIFGPAVIVGILGTALQVGLEWYWNKTHPEARRKLRAVSTTLLNYQDFIEHMQNPKTTLYKEYDWRYVLVGFVVQGAAFFTPCMYLFGSYTMVSMMTFWPVVALTTFSCWDALWLLFILVERKSDDDGNVRFTDFDPQLKVLKITFDRSQQQQQQQQQPLLSPRELDSATPEQEVKKIDEEDKGLSQAQLDGGGLQRNEGEAAKSELMNESHHQPSQDELDPTEIRLPAILDDLLPSTKARTFKQAHEAAAVHSLAAFVAFALIKFVPGSFATPLVALAFFLLFFAVGAVWRTRNSFKLVANDDGTLTFFLEKISSSGFSISIDITNSLLRGSCSFNFIHDARFYEANKIDKLEFLVAHFFADHLKYDFFLHPNSEAKVQQQLEWLGIVVKNSHRDLYTSENTAEVPRKQTADSHLAHLVTFVGRANQSEDLLQLALRLDPNSALTHASLHAMTVDGQDPASLGFERRRGDQTRLSLRAFVWIGACICSFYGLIIPTSSGTEAPLRAGGGGGAYFCSAPFGIWQGMFLRNVADIDQKTVPRIALFLFPQLMYVEVFVYFLVVVVHTDMVYRKRSILESPMLIRLQAAAGVLAAFHWPAVISFIVVFTTTDLDVLIRQEVLGLFVWKCVQALIAIIGPLLGLVFPLVS